MTTTLFVLAVGGAAMVSLLLIAQVRRRLNFRLTADAYSLKRDLAIDGIRGVVSSAVVVGHLGTLDMPYFAMVVDSSIFLYAVSMFTAMSGYVLYAGLSQSDQLTGGGERSSPS